MFQMFVRLARYQRTTLCWPQNLLNAQLYNTLKVTFSSRPAQTTFITSAVSPFVLPLGQDFQKRSRNTPPPPPPQPSSQRSEQEGEECGEGLSNLPTEQADPPSSSVVTKAHSDGDGDNEDTKASVEILTPRTISGSYVNIYGQDLDFFEAYSSLNKICTQSRKQKRIFSHSSKKLKQSISFLSKCIALPGWIWRYIMYRWECFMLRPLPNKDIITTKSSAPINTIFVDPHQPQTTPPQPLTPAFVPLSFPTKHTMPYIEPTVDYIDIHEANTIPVLYSKHYTTQSPKLKKVFLAILAVMINFALSGPSATRQEMSSRLSLFSTLPIEAQAERLYDGIVSTSHHSIQPSKMAITLMLKLHESTLKSLFDERIAFYKGPEDSKDEIVAQAIMDCCLSFNVIEINDIIMAYHVTAKTIFYDPLCCEKIMAYLEQLKLMKKTKTFARTQTDKDWIAQAEAISSQLAMLSVALYLDELKRFTTTTCQQVITAFVQEPFVSWGQYLLTQPATSQRFTLPNDPLAEFLSTALEFDALPMNQAPNVDTFQLIKNQLIEFSTVLSVPYFEQALRYLFAPMRSRADRHLEALYLINPSAFPTPPTQPGTTSGGATATPTPLLPSVEFAPGEAFLDRNTKLELTPLVDCAFAQLFPVFELLDLDRYTIYQAFYSNRFSLMLDGYMAMNIALGATLAFLKSEGKARKLALPNWFDLTLKTMLLGLSFTITYLKNQQELNSYDFDQVNALLLRDKYNIEEW